MSSTHSEKLCIGNVVEHRTVACPGVMWITLFYVLMQYILRCIVLFVFFTDIVIDELEKQHVHVIKTYLIWQEGWGGLEAVKKKIRRHMKNFRPDTSLTDVVWV